MAARLRADRARQGPHAHLDDDDWISGALNRASADSVLDALSFGLSTQLGRQFEGVDLSTGQWQKLALGRTMMRTDPLLLILDEPTASLDAQTEHALFEHFARAASTYRARNGTITILVSHRFSTVRMANLILVVADRRIAEIGTDRELLDAGGLYAELYTLQASAYRWEWGTGRAEIIRLYEDFDKMSGASGVQPATRSLRRRRRLPCLHPRQHSSLCRCQR
ncbi:MAG TPA: ABC transporter ATP-binding protein [Chloroflexota bacterium]|nr:ABC transporter ATP-binding protein [Chloroflexota bacterium]